MGRHKDANPSEHALVQRAWRAKQSPEARSLRVLKYTLYNHRMTMEQYTALRLAQLDRCGACREPLRFGEPRAVTVDHDPRCCQYEGLGTKRTKGQPISCGKCVRALLCGPCNRAVGFLERYPQRVYQWISYLRKVSR
jgi:hypothetical protein